MERTCGKEESGEEASLLDQFNHGNPKEKMKIRSKE